MTKLIAIVLGDKIVDKVSVFGRTDDECFDICFEHADSIYGTNVSYELYDLGNPRHQILFESLNKELFK